MESVPGSGKDEDGALVLACRSMSSNALPQYHTVLCLLHELDNLWFQHNILKKPVATGVSSSFCCRSSSSRQDPLYSPSSSRSIEMVTMKRRCGIYKHKSCTFPQTHVNAYKVRQAQAVHPRNHEDGHPLHDDNMRRNSHINKPLSIHFRTHRQDHTNGNMWTCDTPITTSISSEFSKPCKRNTKEIQVSSPSKVLGTGHGLVPLQFIGDRKRQTWLQDTANSDNEEQEDLVFQFYKYYITPRSLFDVMLMSDAVGAKIGGCRGLLQNKAFWLHESSVPPLSNWQILGLTGDMKEQLKFWARAVAFTVRQEC